MPGEFEVLGGLLPRLGAAPTGEVWAGDDAAVLSLGAGAGAGAGAGLLVVAVDPVVEGVHWDRTLTGPADAGWKAIARNVSDMAAMGAVPWRCLVSVVGGGPGDVDLLYDGLLAAAERWSCPVVGGDLASGPAFVVTVTMLGRTAGPPVLRSGARAGDDVWLAVPGGGGLGRGAAGLRLLRTGAGRGSRAGAGVGAAERWYARPEPSVAAGLAAAAAGATAMIDISDGLVGDLGHVAAASGVGFALAGVPVADDATPLEALTGGDEYALVFTAPPGSSLAATFAAADLALPVHIGVAVADATERTIGGRPWPPGAWQHEL